MLTTVAWLPLIVGATAAHAQEQAPNAASGVGVAAPVASDAQAADNATAVSTSDIVVTGSRLRGTAPVGSTVMTVNRETIVASGATTVDQAVAQVPSLSGLGLGEGSRSSQGGNNNNTAITSANLRGLGPSATLTLVNGHRLPLSGNTANAVDLNSVPTLALERVEVLADGASAVYGSDAVAGVVNLILRRNVDGVEVVGRRSFADGYHDWRVGGIAGHSWSGGQITAAFERNYHTRLASDQRPYNTRDTKAADTNCPLGNAVVSGVFYPIQTNGTIGAAGTPNTCKPYASNDYLPSVRRINASLTADLELTSWLKFRGDATYSNRKSRLQYAYTPAPIDIPQSNPYFQLPPGVTLAQLPNCTAAAIATQKCLRVNYYIGGALGQTRTYNAIEKTYTFHPELDVALGHGWNLTGEATIGHNDANTVGIGYNTTLLTTATRGTTTATAFDPFANRTNPTVLANIANYVQSGIPSERLNVYDATLSGPLFHLPGGDVKLAVSGEYRKEGYVFRSRNGPAEQALSVVTYDRTVKAVSGEINVPLVGSANAIPGIESLDLNVAGRYEKYSDFGSTTNPKFAANWSPVRGVTLKGSYSTSFHAPPAYQLVSGLPPSLYIQTVDPLAGGASRTTLQTNGPNPALQPETSKNLSFAIELTPQFIPHFRASASYFKINYKNVIQAQFNNPDILNQEATFASIITRNPTAAQIAALVAQFPPVNGPTGTVVALVDGRPNNLGQILEDGIDLSLNYSLPTNAGLFNLFLSGTYLFRYDVKATKVASAVDQLDKYGFPVDLKGRGGISWNSGGLNATVFANYIDSYKYGTAKVKSWTTFDLYAGYTLKGRLLNDLTIGVNATNVFDKAPPFVDIQAYLFNPGGFDPAQASALGRLVAVTVTKKF